MAALASLEEIWPGKLPDAERLTFVQLTKERQILALERLRAVLDVEDGREAAAGLMTRLSLGRSQVYKLLQDWKGSRSLTSLVPHAGPSKVRASRLNERVIQLVRRVVREHIERQPPESETTVIRDVQTRAAQEGLPVPADATLRRLIAIWTLNDPKLSLSPLARGQKGALQPSEATAPDDEAKELLFPDVFGGRLLVDHTTPDLIVETSAPFKPTASFVVDDASRLILAHRLIDRIPGPDDFLTILAFASDGYRRLRSKGILAVHGLHPVLTMRNGLSAQWNHLRAVAQRSRFKFDIRRAPQPVFGHVLRRSMIREIGGIALLPGLTKEEPVCRLRNNDVRTPRVSWPDAMAMLDNAVMEHNRQRLRVVSMDTLSGTGRNANLRLNTERRDWLEFGLLEFREAWASR